MTYFWNYSTTYNPSATMAVELTKLYQGHYNNKAEAFSALGLLMYMLHEDGFEMLCDGTVVTLTNTQGTKSIYLSLKLRW